MMVDKQAHTNDLNLPTGQRPGCESKALATLTARLALVGHTLTRSNPADGAIVYFVGRWGYVKALPSLDAVVAFLQQIGGSDV